MAGLGRIQRQDRGGFVDHPRVFHQQQRPGFGQGEALAFAALALAGKLAVLGVMLALAETTLAKMRLFRAPLFLNLAFLLALLGMFSHVILEVGA